MNSCATFGKALVDKAFYGIMSPQPFAERRLKPGDFECPVSAQRRRCMARKLTEVRLKTLKPPAKGRVVEVDGGRDSGD
jgi:hypothetical protein